jgi:hypothetical protein
MKPSMARRSGSITTVDVLFAGGGFNFFRRGFFDTGICLLPVVWRCLADIVTALRNQPPNAPVHRSFASLAVFAAKRFPGHDRRFVFREHVAKFTYNGRYVNGSTRRSPAE